MRHAPIPRFPAPADDPEPLYCADDCARDWTITLEACQWADEDGDGSTPEPVLALGLEDASDHHRALLSVQQARELGETMLAWAAQHERPRAQA